MTAMIGPGNLLTEDEVNAITLAGELWGLLCKIVGDDETRDSDLKELIAPIHQIQHAVMGQAAARAYPETLRLLGGRLQ